MADQLERVLIVRQSVINEQSAEEGARVPQATSSTSNEFAHFHHQRDTEGMQVVTVDLVGGDTPTPTTRETARIQEVCSTSESDDEDEPVSEQEQVREMPNLAAVALERLASTDELPEDDFRPVKKKCFPTAKSDGSGDSESEVSLCIFSG